jgi:two-component system sensor histidine kinase HydH
MELEKGNFDGRGHFTSLSISAVLILLITFLHYITPTALPVRHDIYYRLYYIPIIISAFSFGLRGGVISALVISILIFPHILFDWGGLLFRNMNMIIEVVLYNIVGILTGFLVSSDRKKRRELEHARARLEESLKELELRGERLIEAEKSLRGQEKLALMGEMSAIMAHEIRNPLGSIQGAAEILSDRVTGTGEEEAVKYASILKKEVKRLDDVVTGLIESARPRERVKGPVALNLVLQDVIYLYSRSARKRGVNIVERYAESLPDVLADEGMMRQVFVNVFLNAVEAVGEGGEVAVSTAAGPEGVTVSIRDSGRGIPEEELHRLFDLFYTTKEEGTGLGLAVTRRIIEEHGGRIEIKSKVGEGTEVVIELPVWKGDNNR